MERPLYFYEIAHIITSNKVGTVGLLNGAGVAVSEDINNEELFKVILENKERSGLKQEIFKLYDRNPLNQYCSSCYDTIRQLHDAGVKINDELKSKSE